MPETVTDDELINCGFDLAFHYYLVSYCTNCVQHSNVSLHRYTDLKYTNMIATISGRFTKQWKEEDYK